MATVELTLEQLRDAIIQLPTPQRRKLLAEIEHLPSAEEARARRRRDFVCDWFSFLIIVGEVAGRLVGDGPRVSQSNFHVA